MSNDKVGRWYFGGIAGSMAACVTHPLDLIKVQMQTHSGKVSMPRMAMKILKSDGIGGFYSGLTASVMRQMTYTITRFGCYETAKKQMPAGSNNSFIQKVGLAAISGAAGGLVGSPSDLINVRMQNDTKLPFEQRRNYRNVIDGLFRISREEGVQRLFSGGTMNVTRAVVMTVGQLAFYDQVKQMLIQHTVMEDNVSTHLLSAITAASVATILTQPVDVLKTRMMNAKPGEFKGVADCFLYTARTGPTSFFRGLVPSFIRMTPHTICLFLFVEQLRLNFGYLRQLPTTQKLTH